MIFKKLAEIQGAIRGLSKDAKGYGYGYVSGDKLLSQVRPMMSERGLLLMPEVDGIELTPVTYKLWSSQARTMIEKTEILTKLSLTMKWVDSEDGETLSEPWGAVGMNAFDKGFGSALTYGERYYLLKLFHIPTDKDDVDAVGAERDKALAEAEAQSPAKVFRLTPEGWKKAVEAEVAGRLTKDGKEIRAWMAERGADDETIIRFDADCASYKRTQDESARLVEKAKAMKAGAKKGEAPKAGTVE